MVLAHVRSGLSVTLLLPLKPEDGGEADTYLAVMRKAASLAREDPQLVELALGYEPLPGARRYQSLRQAVEVRREFRRIAVGATPPLFCIWHSTPRTDDDLHALRAAGFRVAFDLSQSERSETVVDIPDWGLVNFQGAIRHQLSADPRALFQTIEDADDDQVILLQHGETQASDSLEVWTAAAIDAFWEGAVSFARPSDYLLQSTAGASKLAVLLLDGTQTTENMADFARTLARNEIPFTWIDKSDASSCTLLAPDRTALDWRCVTSTNPAPDASVQLVLRSAATVKGWSGPDELARIDLDISAADPLDLTGHLAAHPLEDEVLMIDVSHVDTPLKQATVHAQINKARQDGLVHFMSFNDYIDIQFAPDAVLHRYWHLGTHPTPERRNPVSQTPAAQDDDMADAALAWRWIVETRHPSTRLAAGTRQAGRFTTINRDISFWDVGSQLLGTQAAHQLGLISRDDTLAEIQTIFDNLPTLDIDGLALPPALFNGANGSPVLFGYDVCDIGRFLSAMQNLVTKGIVSFSDAEAVLARWDLTATVRDGKAFGHRDQRWTEMTQNHCATYTAKSFAFFGMEIDPAIDVLDAQSNADARIAVMYQADDIGHYGAEPYLLEAIEGGMTPQSQLLAEALLAAQMQWFQDTGHLKCVSEAPLNFAPWFSFQGLRLGRSGAESWVISTPEHAETAPSAALTSRAAMISAKAAFLWDATYPGAYTSTIVETVRQSARLADGGFSVGLLESDGSALADYSDVNTNGIILQAIAYKLGQR